MATGRVGKADAQRNREESYAHVKTNLEAALKSIELAQDWERSWPNKVTNLGSDLESIRNKMRIILRSVGPVENDGHVRVLPVMKTEDFDAAETNVIVIGDD